MDTQEKQLYAVNLTEDKKNERADTTPYHTAVLSDGLRARASEAGDAVGKQLLRGFGLPQYLAGILCTAIGAIVLCALIRPLLDSFSTGETGVVLGRSWPIALGGAILLVVGLVILRMHKKRHEDPDEDPEMNAVASQLDNLLVVGLVILRMHKKRHEDPDEDLEMNAVASQLDNINQLVSDELGLPDEERLTQIDVLSFRYKISGDKVREVRENHVYENALLFMWRDGDTLCITDHDALITVPLADIESCTVADEKYVISFWWKDDEPGEGAYADCDIKEDKNNFNYRGRGIGEVRIRHGEDVYLLRVPGYDFGAFRALIGQ